MTLPSLIESGRAELFTLIGSFYQGETDIIYDFLTSFATKVHNAAIESALEALSKTSLQQLAEFYYSNRQSGSTHAAVNGVANTSQSLLLVANEQQKENTGLPRDKQISLSSRDLILGGKRFAVVIDNFAFTQMVEEARAKLSALKKENV